MDELTSPNIQVVLRIKEGRGFDQILQSTMLVASLNGHVLETNVVEASSSPQFTTDLIWESDKNTLRRLRSGQVPLKLECFAIKEDGSKEKVGYILLSIRSAQIVPRNRSINIKENWHRFLGLKSDFKASKPELLLAMCVEEQEVKPNLIVESNQTPVLIQGEHLIQLGLSNTSQDLFLLKVTVQNLGNIHSLLSEKSLINVEENILLWCKILDNDIPVKLREQNLEKRLIFGEKVVIKIKSSLNELKNNLHQKPFMLLSLHYKNSIIGKTKVDLRSLLPTENIDDFFKCNPNTSTVLEQKYTLIKESSEICLTETNVEPYIDLMIKLTYVGIETNMIEHKNQSFDNPDNPFPHPVPNNNKDQSTFHNNEVSSIFPDAKLHRNPYGDCNKNTEHCTWTCSMGHNVCNKFSKNHETFKNPSSSSISSCIPNKVEHSCINTEFSRSSEAYHCYCLHIRLNAITLLSSNLKIQDINFRFHHPKAQIISTLNQKIPISSCEKLMFQDIGCKLQFISTENEIRNLLLSFPPKITIHDAGANEKIFLSECLLDVKRLFPQAKFECQYEAPLHDASKKHIGNLDITLKLENQGPYCKTTRTYGENLGPPILDDSLAYKIVDELETWKERQKEMFKFELKKKEERHLNLLAEEWQKRKENLETKLACSVEQCKMLAKNLNNATEDLKSRRLKTFEKEARLIQTNEDLQWRYESKLQEIRDSYHALKEDLTTKINILEDRKVLLESRIEPLMAENEELRKTVMKLKEKLDTFEKGSLNQDQTSSLLQELKILEEKLRSAQKSKNFFKEQWAKAVREIHKMRTDYQQAIEFQIKSSKEELKNLDLEEILTADSTALTNDRILLDQIQKEIDIIKPNLNFQ